MFKKILDFFKSKKQKGQSLAFFAISVPFLCLFVGAAMDFGWMYYNQSRLQNAADSAALIGARTLIGGSKYKMVNYTYTDMPLSQYDTAAFVSNSDPGLLLMQQNSTVSSKTKDGVDSKKYPYGDSIAKIYALSNLKGTRAYDDSDTSQSSVKVKLVDSDNVGSVSGYENVKFESKLWGPNEDDEDSLYYTVTLSTKLDHLFGGIMENFGIAQLPSVATSAVKIFYDGAGLPLYIQMKVKEKNNTFPNWEEIKVQKGNNSTAANNRSVLTGGSYYSSGNVNRVEASLLNGNSFASSKGNPYKTGVDQTAFDDLFIDYQGEMNRNLTTNGDEDLVPNTVSGNWDYGDDTTTNSYKYNYRIHFPVMMVSKYKVRAGKDSDPLYAFIEQEPIKQIVYQSDGTSYLRGNMSSVRQIIICNDYANTDSDARPWVFFYEGPEIPYAPSEPDASDVLNGTMTEDEYYEQLVKLKKQAHSDHPEYYDSDGDYIGDRPFLPIILNLYRDFRGIIFAPNNPVIINGNGYKMEGFVIAREFRRLKIYSDFQNAKYSGSSVSGDNGKPVYVYPNVSTYKGVSSKNAPFYAEVSNWKTKPSVSSEKGGSNNTSSKTTYKYITINGTKYYAATIYLKDTTYQGWVKFGQWSTKSSNPDVNTYVKITLADGTTRYTQVMSSDYKSFTDNIFLEAQLKANSGGTYDLVDSGTAYIAQFDGKFYTPVTEEVVTYTGSVDSLQLGDYYSASGQTIKQKVNTMYVSNTKYKYTESYYNTEGITKTKTTIMSIGDVQYVNVTASDSSLDENGNVTGNYTETPRNYGSFADDDKLRYDYVNVFNLKNTSTYSSFNNAQLRNYIYLKKTEKSTMSSHDMFFTTKRSRHIN